jgi:hypothetical protein
MKPSLALFAALAVAAGCAGASSHQVSVVNERPEPVVVVMEILSGDLGSEPAEVLDYTVPPSSSACTYCGTGPLRNVRLIVYAARGCVQLGAAVLIGTNAYELTVPPEGLVELEALRAPAASPGPQVEAASTECG